MHYYYYYYYMYIVCWIELNDVRNLTNFFIIYLYTIYYDDVPWVQFQFIFFLKIISISIILDYFIISCGYDHIPVNERI